MSRIDTIAATLRERAPQSRLRIYSAGETHHYAGTLPEASAFDYADPMNPGAREVVAYRWPDGSVEHRNGPDVGPKPLPGHRVFTG